MPTRQPRGSTADFPQKLRAKKSYPPCPSGLLMSVRPRSSRKLLRVIGLAIPARFERAFANVGGKRKAGLGEAGLGWSVCADRPEFAR